MHGMSRHVTKYAALYSDLGFSSSTIVLSRGLDFFTPWTSVAAETAARLCDPTQTLRLHVHIMSNGGARSWFCLEQHLQRRQQPYIVTSFVFDSAPSMVRGGVGDPRPFVAHVKNPVARGALYGVMKLVMVAWSALAWLLRWDHPFTQLFESQICTTGAIPKLFLYSSADTMVVATDVEDAILVAKAVGARVESVDFKTSAHVAHYMAHPETYRAALASFFPWYDTLEGKYFTLQGFRMTWLGRQCTHILVSTLEFLKIALKGTVKVSLMLKKTTLSLPARWTSSRRLYYLRPGSTAVAMGVWL
ncbi:hypothetical protein SPRG_06697 [Saprolegnia parasitica CBS 223.65]|uniref:Sterol methyltransferase C-terminal domain-containing protein n=1 Tax=Saprolegnia parasitica (strain CBS 223.65) TaxID=695850 RepID=A0A067CD73_SAPPC|nr:hypothetical protein SPRG_06697 [Saprolegnia parasitica CBS 223.65]KDO28458.1 hypothetical protein SPRG_06697 [Saprolegnia parasitica CBS 223.65]|eukprot:XP_012200898.1 hypothetical protein SPRG_06697 [Saprolegnia parasitica CBS 223.65]